MVKTLRKFRAAMDFELKALDGAPEGTVAGWASTPDLDEYGHVVKTGAFNESIAERGLSGPKGIRLLINHDWGKPAGVIKVLETRGGRLWIEAELNLKISYARDAYEASKSAGGLNFSVGFFMRKWEVERDDDGDPISLTIIKGDLFEISVVTFPGNTEATMEFVKSLNLPDAELADFEYDEPCSTLAVFTKRLVKAGLATSRNEADEMLLDVQKALGLLSVMNAPVSLFVKNAPKDPDPQEPSDPQPQAISANALDALAKALSRANEVLNIGKKEA
jgi:HK97 family phage prohead protease